MVNQVQQLPGKGMLVADYIDPNGNIQVFRAFWERDTKDKKDILDTVDPIIVYADLLETGDIRNLEAAKLLYQNELTEFIRED
jgi:hypothetical protein